MIDQIENLAREHQARYVEAIEVEIGDLSGVDPGLFADAFAVMRQGTCAALAVLSTLPSRTRVQCISCNQRTYTRPNRLLCGICSSYRVTVVEGHELRLRNVKLNLFE